MELLTIKIIPKSAFVTIPKGDTLFGQILSYLFLKNDKTFKNYLNEKPKLIVSDMMPFGYVYKPTLPLKYFNTDDKKLLRKKEFISIKDLQNGNLQNCQKIKYKIENVVVKNHIDRTTFSTSKDDFAPYNTTEITYLKDLWIFIMVETCIKDKIINTIEDIGKFGFGKEANVGKGIFDIELISNHIQDITSNYYMSISPTILQDNKFEKCFYEPFTRFGKFGLGESSYTAFKKPVLLADSGAVVKTKLNEQYFGNTINNGYKDKPSFIQGYSTAIPFQLNEK